MKLLRSEVSVFRNHNRYYQRWVLESIEVMKGKEIIRREAVKYNFISGTFYVNYKDKQR